MQHLFKQGIQNLLFSHTTPGLFVYNIQNKLKMQHIFK